MLVVEPIIIGAGPGSVPPVEPGSLRLRVALRKLSRNHHAYDVGHSI